MKMQRDLQGKNSTKQCANLFTLIELLVEIQIIVILNKCECLDNCVTTHHNNR